MTDPPALSASIGKERPGVQGPLGPRKAPEGLSSLASYGESVASFQENDSERCPRSRGRWINRNTGEWFWDRCGRNSCVKCGPSKARSVAGAVGVCEPERFVRWSLVGDDWQVARARLKRVRYRCRQDVRNWQDCYFIERNPNGTGFHAHGYQWGGFLAQSRLQQHCLREGVGYPWIAKWEPTSVRAYGYAMKHATGYGLKLAQRSETLREYLDWNGGRLIHASRGFWRDGARGGRLAGVDAARRVWRERAFGPSPAWSLADWKLEAA